jgi:uncharacterized protein
VVANGEDVTMETTLEEAVATAVGGVVPTEPTEPTEPGEPTEPTEPGQPQVPSEVAALLAEAEQHFELAEAALAEGDLATYEAEIEEAQRLVAEAAALVAGAETPAGGG